MLLRVDGRVMIQDTRLEIHPDGQLVVFGAAAQAPDSTGVVRGLWAALAGPRCRCGTAAVAHLDQGTTQTYVGG